MIKVVLKRPTCRWVAYQMKWVDVGFLVSSILWQLVVLYLHRGSYDWDLALMQQLYPIVLWGQKWYFGGCVLRKITRALLGPPVNPWERIPLDRSRL